MLVVWIVNVKVGEMRMFVIVYFILKKYEVCDMMVIVKFVLEDGIVF